ncbi:MAG: hypothetical protein HYV63_03455 [Candidatus Schekmanbacteria bacterium]|nr:hypothetical protein [Candidatus Schekmanbacteria bacterium]
MKISSRFTVFPSTVLFFTCILTPIAASGWSQVVHNKMAEMGFGRTQDRIGPVIRELGLDIRRVFRGPRIPRSWLYDIAAPGCKLAAEVSADTPRDWILYGAVAEDEVLGPTLLLSCGENFRAQNHFYNPELAAVGGTRGRRQGGLDDVALVGIASPLYERRRVSHGLPLPRWALGEDFRGTSLLAGATFHRDDSEQNAFSHRAARDYFWKALTLVDDPLTAYNDESRWSCPDKEEELARFVSRAEPVAAVRDRYPPPCREGSWARLFRALGQVAHLVQDAAQPEHTRNDSHPQYTNLDPFPKAHEELYSLHPELAAVDWRALVPSGSPSFLDFFDQQTRGRAGIAQLSSAHFVTSHTLPAGVTLTARDPLPPAVHLTLGPPLYGDSARRQFAEPALAGLGLVTYQAPGPPFLVAPAIFGLGGERKLVAFRYDERPDALFAPADPDLDDCPQNVSESVQRDDYRCYREEQIGRQIWTTNDDKVKRSIAEAMLPLAIGYSAAYLEWFFRGRLSVPSAFVHSQNGRHLMDIVVQNDSEEDWADAELAFIATIRAPDDEDKDERRQYVALEVLQGNARGIALSGTRSQPEPAAQRTGVITVEIPQLLFVDGFRNALVEGLRNLEVTVAIRGGLGGETLAEDGTGGAVAGVVARPGALVEVGSLSGGAVDTDSRALSDTGYLVGCSYTEDRKRHGFVWRDGVIFDATPGADFGCMHDVNSAGQAVGYAGRYGVGQTALIWEGEQSNSLDAVTGVQTYSAAGINDAGDVTGMWYSEQYPYHRPFAIAGGTGRTLFPSIAGLREIFLGRVSPRYANAQSAAAYAPGQVITQSYAFLPIVTTIVAQGEEVPPGLVYLELPPGRTSGSANGANGNGLLAGNVYTSGQTRSRRAAVWTTAGVKELGTLGGYESTNYGGVNNRNQVVGGSAVTGDLGYHAYIWQDDRMSDLNDYLPPQWDWIVLWDAADINDHGEVAVDGLVDGRAPWRSYLLRSYGGKRLRDGSAGAWRQAVVPATAGLPEPFARECGELDERELEGVLLTGDDSRCFER